MRYCIDTSAIIEGWHKLFPPDIVPGFWEGVDELIKNGDLRATEEVLIELEKKDDQIYSWARQRNELFVPIDLDIQVYVREILAKYKTLIDTRKNRSGADPFVIALAGLNKNTSTVVVTEERLNEKIERPHIPDICAALDIGWINLNELVRKEGWKFHR